MESKRVTATVTTTNCPRYKVGDKIVFEGPEEHNPMQCPDCKEAVVFEFTRE